MNWQPYLHFENQIDRKLKILQYDTELLWTWFARTILGFGALCRFVIREDSLVVNFAFKFLVYVRSFWWGNEIFQFCSFLFMLCSVVRFYLFSLLVGRIWWRFNFVSSILEVFGEGMRFFNFVHFCLCFVQIDIWCVLMFSLFYIWECYLCRLL